MLLLTSKPLRASRNLSQSLGIWSLPPLVNRRPLSLARCHNRQSNNSIYLFGKRATTVVEFPKFLKSVHFQTTFFSGVTSMICGLAASAWQFPISVLPLASRSARVTHASVMPGRSFCSIFHTIFFSGDTSSTLCHSQPRSTYCHCPAE